MPELFSYSSNRLELTLMPPQAGKTPSALFQQGFHPFSNTTSCHLPRGRSDQIAPIWHSQQQPSPSPLPRALLPGWRWKTGWEALGITGMEVGAGNPTTPLAHASVLPVAAHLALAAQPPLLQPGPDALNPARVLRVVAVVSAGALVLEHHRVVNQPCKNAHGELLA